MPVMDGYEASRQLREMLFRGLLPETPIIAITANVGNSDKEICLKNGMDYFLSKPLRRSESLQKVEMALKKRDKKFSIPTPIQIRL